MKRLVEGMQNELTQFAQNRVTPGGVQEIIQKRFSDGFNTFTGQLTGLERRIEDKIASLDNSWVDAAGEFGNEVQSLKTGQGIVSDGLGVTLTTLSEMGIKLDGIVARMTKIMESSPQVDALRAEIDEIRQAVGKGGFTPSGAAPRLEKHLNPELKLTVAQWCNYKGKHRRLFSTKGQHTQLGKAVSMAYKRYDIPVEVDPDGSTARFVYPVADLRHFKTWLVTNLNDEDDSGDDELYDINYDEWYHYFERFALPEWKARRSANKTRSDWNATVVAKGL